MEQQRNIILIVLLCATLFIFWNWNSDKVNAAKLAEQEAIAAQMVDNTSATESSLGKIITLKSDNLALSINLNGGDIIDAKLLKVMKEQGKDEPFQLLLTNKLFMYQAQSGAVGKDGPDSKVRPVYTATADSYELKDGENSVSASLVYESNGVTYTKTYTLDRDSYVVNLNYKVDNHSDKPVQMSFYSQLKQTEDISVLQKEDQSFAMVASAYRGTAYSSDESRYEKATLENIIEEKHPDVNTKNGWVAMIQHYFVSAWIGDDKAQGNIIYSQAANNNTAAIIGIRTDNTVIDAGSTHDFNSKLWVGPKDQETMASVANNLDLTVDYGWLWFISIPLFKILSFFHSLIGNWGFSIILLTLVVRGVMFPLTKAQYTSMAKMRLLQPKMVELRERYKDDRAKLGQETMRLYKTEKVNPLGGCLPLIIQMPIFIALYWTLMESTELRQSSFILWITDLSVYDPYFVTPILYGISMFFLQKMSPTPVTDPIQKKVFMAMPFVFTFMFCTFPAGLTLYWLVSNCFTIFQQVIIFRSLEKKGLSMKKAKAEAK